MVIPGLMRMPLLVVNAASRQCLALLQHTQDEHMSSLVGLQICNLLQPRLQVQLVRALVNKALGMSFQSLSTIGTVVVLVVVVS
jgi:hypothetical protein